MNAQLPEQSPTASGLSANSRSDDPKHDLLERALYDAYSSGRKDEREEWMPVLEALRDMLDLTVHTLPTTHPLSKRAQAAIAKVTQ